ncbi:MAG: acyl-CoA--6-aminopenicillanic acid acyltransferase [Promethearchaeota archaeon]
MCDTLVADASTTRDGVVLFAKNSDRDFNEAQQVVHVAAADHPDGGALRCTHVTIPQVAHTHEVVLSKPYWIWGAEMGANEHGVVAGNETVFTREPLPTKPGLIGMDLLRLGLERGRTSREALDVIVALLAEYGQGGACSATDPNYQYHNSFLIADPNEAWVLETAGRYWAAEKVEGTRSISNGLTIGEKIDLAHPDLISHAVEAGWAKDDDGFDFSLAYADPTLEEVAGAAARRACTSSNLARKAGELELADLVAYLRDHGAAGEKWTPARCDMTSVCLHASPRTISQTTGSQVSVLRPGGEVSVHFFTGTPTPCLSLFKPVFLPGAGVEVPGPPPGAEYDERALWWAGERLHRLVDLDYGARAPVVQADRDAVEQRLLGEALALAERLERATSEERAREGRAFSTRAFELGHEKVREWTENVRQVPVDPKTSRRMAKFFKKYDEEANAPPLA